MDLTESIAPKSDQEMWRPVVGYEGAYDVSNVGRVRSLNRTTDRGRKWSGRILQPSPMRNGYLIVTLWREGAQRSALVHRLVLTAFFGMPASGQEALHGDGDKTNNALVNLSWGTHSENQLDQVDHGTHPNASKDQCLSGHPYDEGNTYSYPGRTHRACRTCRRDYMHAWQAKQKVGAV